MRDIKYKFVIDGRVITRAYTLKEILEEAIDNVKIMENEDSKRCFSCSEEYCECEGDYENSTITHKLQYTGYLDTNKNEACDQDIIKVFDGDEVAGIGLIEWCHDGWYAAGTGYRVNDSLSNATYGGFEIIGNEFENPELLEVSGE